MLPTASFFISFIIIIFLILQNNLSTDISEKSRVRFEDVGNPGVVPCDGTPFIILARYERHCLFGKDKHRKK